MTFRAWILLGLQISIFLTVFGFGLQASAADVLYLARRPAVVVRSLLSMFVVMPVVTAIAITVLDLHRAVEVAIMALAISPIPPLLPGREVRAGGRGSYALGLMVVAALLSIVVTPTALYLLGLIAERSFAFNPRAVAWLALISVIVPLAAGVMVRGAAGGFAERIRKPLSVVANVLLITGMAAILPAAAPAMWALIGDGTLLSIVAFVAFGLATGHVFGGPDRDERIVLALSTACRHPSIALTIAMTAFPEERLLIGAVVLYMLLNIVVSVPYVVRQRRLAQVARRGA